MLPAHSALAAMAYLLAKHAVADFGLQPQLIYNQKGIYGAGGGLLHAFIHIFLTLPVFLLFPTGTVGLAAALLAGEFIVHYHIDWAKDQIVRHNGWKLSDRQYWCALGLDQLLHGLTYIAILWIWLPAA
jgi:hypothetical protein